FGARPRHAARAVRRNEDEVRKDRGRDLPEGRVDRGAEGGGVGRIRRHPLLVGAHVYARLVRVVEVAGLEVELAVAVVLPVAVDVPGEDRSLPAGGSAVVTRVEGEA